MLILIVLYVHYTADGVKSVQNVKYASGIYSLTLLSSIKLTLNLATVVNAAILIAL